MFCDVSPLKFDWRPAYYHIIILFDEFIEAIVNVYRTEELIETVTMTMVHMVIREIDYQIEEQMIENETETTVMVHRQQNEKWKRNQCLADCPDRQAIETMILNRN